MRCKEFIEKWGLNQRQLAQLADISPSSVARYMGARDSHGPRREDGPLLQTLSFWDRLFTFWLAAETEYRSGYEIYLEVQGRKKAALEDPNLPFRYDRLLHLIRAIAGMESIDVFQLQRICDEVGIPSDRLAQALNGLMIETSGEKENDHHRKKRHG